MINYEEFLQSVRDAVAEKLDRSVNIRDTLKNNGVRLHALEIHTEGINIAPVIYLDFYYDAYTRGMTMEDIVTDIVAVYESSLPKNSIDTQFFTKYENAEKKIVAKLVNYKRNKELLQDIPYVKYLDLVIVFICMAEADNGEIMSVLIRNEHLDIWKVTAEDVYRTAMKNTPELLAYQMEDILDILKVHVPALPKDNFMQMQVLTNEKKIFGAAVILYPQLLAWISKQFQDDVVLLPSSIHEWIVLPASLAGDLEELTRLVMEVNRDQLTQQEILSDHAYYYSVEQDRVMLPKELYQLLDRQEQAG